MSRDSVLGHRGWPALEWPGVVCIGMRNTLTGALRPLDATDVGALMVDWERYAGGPPKGLRSVLLPAPPLGIVDHEPSSYDGAFFALACFASTRAEAFTAWAAERWDRAWALLGQCLVWWDAFKVRRRRARQERRARG